MKILLMLITVLSTIGAEATEVAHWRFESGTVTIDSSGNGHTLAAGAAGSTPTATAIPALGAGSAFPPPQGTASNAGMIGLDGGDRYLTANPSGTFVKNAFTIEAFIHFTSGADVTQVIAGVWDSGTNARSWNFGVRNGQLRLNYTSVGSGTTSDVFVSSTLQTGHDYFVAAAVDLTRTSGAVVLYVKDLTAGTPGVAYAFSRGTVTTLASSGASFSIGATGNATPTSPYTGVIDEVRYSTGQLEGADLLLPIDPPSSVRPEAGGFNGIWYEITSGRGSYPNKYGGGMATYPQQHAPMAIHAPAANRTFFVFGGSDKGPGEVSTTIHHSISYYDHVTRRVARPRIVLDKQTDNAHDNPALSIDDDGHLWVFSNAHGNNRRSHIFRSDSPYDITAFTEIPLEIGVFSARRFNYGQPWFVPGQGFVLLFTRYNGSDRDLYVTTSADGVTWTPRRLFSQMLEGQYQISWRHGQTIGTAFNVHDGGSDNRTNLYYLQTSDFAQTWTTAGGVEVALPLTDPVNPALVHDYRSEGRNVYLKDVNFDAAGHPVILFLTSGGASPGLANGPRTLHTARWSGSAWIHRDVFATDHNYDHGSLYIESDGTWRIVGPFIDGPQVWGTGGEVGVWTSSDEGLTWQLARQLTTSSAFNHSYVRRPLDAHDDFHALWADGDAWEPSASSLYFTDRHGDALMRLPAVMPKSAAFPEAIAIYEPDTDPDGDGQSTGAEFTAGTHPRDAASVFRLADAELVDGEMRVSFPTVPDRTYRVMVSEDLASGSWQPLIEGIVGDGEIVTVVAETGVGTEPQRFYRAEIEP